MKLKFKKLNENAIIPQKATKYDAGMDITATAVVPEGVNMYTYHTGLSVEIPEGYFGLLVPRSSIYKYDLILSNSCGIIDSKYRGELMFKYRVTSHTPPNRYHAGDRIGQLIILPLPNIEPIEVEELDMNENRGGGFGSTGV